MFEAFSGEIFRFKKINVIQNGGHCKIDMT